MAILVIALSVVVGTALASVFRGFGDVGRTVASAGSKLHSTLDSAAGAIGGLPVVGSQASSPLSGAARAANQLTAAGEQQQASVGHLSLAVGLIVALVPIAVVLVLWLPRRLAFARRAAAVTRLASLDGGIELLALRALTWSGPDDLLRISPRPVDAWRRGDTLETHLLAELAQRDAGVSR